MEWVGVGVEWVGPVDSEWEGPGWEGARWWAALASLWRDGSGMLLKVVCGPGMWPS